MSRGKFFNRPLDIRKVARASDFWLTSCHQPPQLSLFVGATGGALKVICLNDFI